MKSVYFYTNTTKDCFKVAITDMEGKINDKYLFIFTQIWDIINISLFLPNSETS